MRQISREEAIELEQKWFFTGIACKNGHIDKRYLNNGICYSCKRIQNRSCNFRNPQSLKIRSKRAYEKKDKNILNQRSKDWYSKNVVKARKIKKNWKERNREKYLEYSRLYSRKQRLDPFKRLSKNMSKAIWECLKGNKNHITWLKFVNYSLEELKIHLENKFKTGMNWDNYGKYWHVDHIKPLSWFDLSKEFKEAWKLSNLQPLEAEVNLSKCNRYEG